MSQVDLHVGQKFDQKASGTFEVVEVLEHSICIKMVRDTTDKFIALGWYDKVQMQKWADDGLIWPWEEYKTNATK